MVAANSGNAIFAILATAAAVGVIHTLASPAHYLPFAALAKTHGWPLAKALQNALFCGAGHIVSSILVCAAGMLLGSGVEALESLEGTRANFVKWLFLGFAAAYTAYGLRSAICSKKIPPHAQECECPVCGCEHAFHSKEDKRADKINFWTLFLVFTVGPCEVLIPLVVYPAAKSDWCGALGAAAVFSLSTIATMLAAVTLVHFGLSRANWAWMQRWGGAATGIALLGCALAMFAHH